jgi:hypothetical protein
MEDGSMGMTVEKALPALILQRIEFIDAHSYLARNRGARRGIRRLLW